jgi:hypothetical protein
MSLPKNCLVDTNVPIIANGALKPDLLPQGVDDSCVLACIDAIEHVIKKKALVIDSGDEIFDEYRNKLSLKGQPGMGDLFLKWVHDHRYTLPDSQRVEITKNNGGYDEFPSHAGLTDFDPSDCKFIAVANAHPQKPPILQASDSKWWGWSKALQDVGISVHFLCRSYAETTFAKKQKKKQ